MYPMLRICCRARPTPMRPDGPDNEVNTGYLWDNALRAGLTVRDYGWFVDTTCYNVPACQTPLAHDPFATNTIVAPSTNVALAPYHRSLLPRFRSLLPRLLSLQGMGAGLRYQLRAGWACPI